MAREKVEKAIFTLHTTAMAMKVKRNAKESGSPGWLIPVPRQISTGCGMTQSTPAGDRGTFKTLIREARIKTEGTYNLFL